MDSLLSANVLSVVVAYAMTLFLVRSTVAALRALATPEFHDIDGAYESDDAVCGIGRDRPRRHSSLTAVALVVPILGVFWTAWGEAPLPPWLDMYGESLSDLAYVLGFAMLFPRADIIGLATRRAKLWTATGALVLGWVLVYVPRFPA